jgi:hypothetical protein
LRSVRLNGCYVRPAIVRVGVRVVLPTCTLVVPDSAESGLTNLGLELRFLFNRGLKLLIIIILIKFTFELES